MRSFGINFTSKNIGILVDASDIFLCSQKSYHFRISMKKLLDEQLSNRVENVYLAQYGTTVNHLWPEPQKFDENILTEMKIYFQNSFRNAGGSNLMLGLKHVRKF